jgi:hypothetical protein
MEVDIENNVVDIIEKICLKVGDRYCYMKNGAFIPTQAETIVSVNFFGLSPNVFPLLQEILEEFMENLSTDQSQECGLPQSLARLVKEGKITLKSISTEGKWMGVTYQPDKPILMQSIKDLIREGIYPSPLWK